MKRIALSFVVPVLLFTGTTLNAQQAQPIYFKSGTVTPINNVREFDHDFTSNEIVNGGYYRLLSFDKIPTSSEKQEMQTQGIELLTYIPKNSFFAFVHTDANLTGLKSFSCFSVTPIETKYKLSNELATERYSDWAFDGNYIEIYAHPFSNVTRNEAIAIATKKGAKAIGSSVEWIHFIVPITQLESLFDSPEFQYFEEIPSPETPENLDGRTDHRSNFLASDYSNGLHYDGTGVTVMMQDDGYIGDHIDYQGRADQSNCLACSTDDNDNHGDHVAGTIMGAGNLNPRYRGMAFGADLLVFNSSNTNYDQVPTYYANDEVIITSKSYSSTCNGGYDSRARQLDGQMYDLDGLIHVFSAGNNGNVDCGYGAGAGWGNITGGHKSGKNVIAVGNLTSTDALAGSSSRGPATDGRIKPDICAVGTGVISTISDYDYASKTGTSMSCPGVAGTLAQLYQAYRDANGGNNPPSGLIKGAILNTAEDLGNPGPDFKYGWGRINAIKAHELIENNHYITESVSQGATNNHTISVPNGITRLKIMVYWTDYKGATNATVALVNDLNMVVVDPALNNHLPYVLDPTPIVANLDADAVPGVDDLNNMEQVVIDNPSAGNYAVAINGFAVPQGPQEYFVVYEMIADDIRVTYPIGGEGLYPSTTEKIRWDAAPIAGDFTVEYTTDNGNNWNTIGTASATDRYISWNTPNVVSGETRVRVSRGGQSDESDANFTIMETPQNLDFGWACPDSLNIVWDSVPGATSYDVYMLGTKYMDSIGTSSVTNLTVLASAAIDNWFSVRAYGPNGARSERAVAVRKTPGEFGCSWSAPYAAVELNCDSISLSSCVDVFNASINSNASSSYNWYFPTGTPSTSTLENPTVCFSTSGYHDAALVVSNGAGTDSVYFSDLIFVQTAMNLPYHEGFENFSTFTGLENWSVYNPNGAAFFVTNNVSLSGNQCVRLNNNNQTAGSIDELISGPIDLSVLSTSDVMTLSFRYAYKKSDANSDDWLQVYVKDACDGGWTLRKTLHGNFLSTEISSASWQPSSSSDWTTVHVTNINSAFFTNDFRFKFQFENGGGNNFFLDDINIYQGSPSDTIVSGLTEISVLQGVSIYPNPAQAEVNIQYVSQNGTATHVYITDNAGKLIRSNTIQSGAGKNLVIMDIEGIAPGSYFVILNSEGQQHIEQLIIQ